MIEQNDNICPITGAKMDYVFTKKIIGKYDVKYFYSPESGILQTENPYWLVEAYQSAIAVADTGLVNRNLLNRRRLEPILYNLFGNSGKFLDLGGGYGLLSRMLRDIGFDSYTYDKYCENIFAKTFEPEEGFKADALFAFEVFEHINNPFEFLRDAFEKYNCKTLLFSTLLFEGNVPQEDWWYYSCDFGQHVTFYQKRTLALLAKKFDCSYYKLNRDFHLITDKKITWFNRLLFSNQKLLLIFAMLLRILRINNSFVNDDYIRIKERLNKK
ncbi:MAG: class I SAM-dependent methyltransferase [Ignavibacteriaceae bacterium]|nr:class I SAM-dependent methyltransferase [Ignavibacteriaceae bacterium]